MRPPLAPLCLTLCSFAEALKRRRRTLIAHTTADMNRRHRHIYLHLWPLFFIIGQAIALALSPPTASHVDAADVTSSISRLLLPPPYHDRATPYALSIMGTPYTNNCPFGTGEGYGDGRAVSVGEVVVPPDAAAPPPDGKPVLGWSGVLELSPFSELFPIFLIKILAYSFRKLKFIQHAVVNVSPGSRSILF
jgi:hypothetical protein